MFAAEASECANEQGAFWGYHGLLFANQRGENQGAFRDERLHDFAVELELDMDAFEACMNSGRNRAQVEADLQTGLNRGVSSTPTIFINGRKIEGALPFSQFQEIIEAELKQGKP
jgi:protein-disulfide isomerase